MSFINPFPFLRSQNAAVTLQIFNINLKKKKNKKNKKNKNKTTKNKTKQR